MKKTLLLIIVAFLICNLNLAGQENKFVKHFYASLEAATYMSGNYSRLDNSDWKRNALNIALGYRPNHSWSIYLPYDLEFVQYNMDSTRNYLEQASLGVGTGYQFNVLKENKYRVELSLTASSSIMKSSPGYFTSKLMLKCGASRLCAPYVGIGLAYLHSYDGLLNDSFAIGFTVGNWFF